MTMQKPVRPGQIGIVFDFGNVLLDWNPYYLYAKYFNGDLVRTQKFLDEIGFSIGIYSKMLDVRFPRLSVNCVQLSSIL